MHARRERLARIRDAVRTLVPANGALYDNAAAPLRAIKSGSLSIFPQIIVRAGREEPSSISQGAGDGAPPNVHRRLPIDVTVIAGSEAELDAALASVEKAIPWNDPTTDEAIFEIGDTAFTDADSGNRVVYLATLAITAKYQTGLGQPDA